MKRRVIDNYQGDHNVETNCCDEVPLSTRLQPRGQEGFYLVMRNSGVRRVPSELERVWQHKAVIIQGLSVIELLRPEGRYDCVCNCHLFPRPRIWIGQFVALSITTLIYVQT